MTPQPPDVVISQQCKLAPIADIARQLGIHRDELLPYGNDVAKVKLSILDRLKDAPAGKYIDVTAISPTPLGEGKTTTTIGVSQALGAHLKRKVMTVIRQPSQGPTFGIKGGAAGGGYSQVVPMEAINLHLTGDFHAVTAANNLLAAAIDTRVLLEGQSSDEQLFQRLLPAGRAFNSNVMRRLKRVGMEGKKKPEDFSPAEQSRFARLDIDPTSILWRRVIDTNDRHLREIEIGLGAGERPARRMTGFDITTASECMAILALTTGIKDLRDRVGRIVIGVDKKGEMVTADDLGVGGAMTVLMKDAIMPNLMQTLERTPAFVHIGPFANIAHGNSSVIADMIGLKLVGKDGFVVTESGFGADCGAEKFFNIKCRYSGLKPDAAVLVATVRGLKFQGGGPAVIAGQKLHHVYTSENVELLKKGLCNLDRHVRNVRATGIPCVVALNAYPSDTPTEVELIRKTALAAGAVDCVVGRHYSRGGAGAVELAEAVVRASKQKSEFRFLYPLDMPIKEKIHAIATQVYGAARVQYSPAAEKKVELYNRLKMDKLPICMAKTQYAFGHDPEARGAPTGYALPIRDIALANGAGFLVPLCGNMLRMPALPTRAAFWNVDLTDDGRVVGLN